MLIKLYAFEVETALRDYVCKQYGIDPSKFENTYTELVVNQTQYDRFKNGNFNFKKKKEVNLLMDDNTELELFIEVKNE